MPTKILLLSFIIAFGAAIIGLSIHMIHERNTPQIETHGNLLLCLVIIELALLISLHVYIKLKEEEEERRVIPRRTRTAGTGGILRNPASSRKQYSHWKFFGHFPMISDWFLPKIDWNSPEKNPANFRLENCFHIQLFPMLSCRIRMWESLTWDGTTTQHARDLIKYRQHNTTTNTTRNRSLIK